MILSSLQAQNRMKKTTLERIYQAVEEVIRVASRKSKRLVRKNYRRITVTKILRKVVAKRLKKLSSKYPIKPVKNQYPKITQKAPIKLVLRS